jgi:hypothetical protein
MVWVKAALAADGMGESGARGGWYGEKRRSRKMVMKNE